MAKHIKADICVIGGGSGGLAVAAGAAMLGRKTVLIEKGKMGGDCLNYGCVPSKALLSAAKHAKYMSAGEPFGIARQEAQVDFRAVHDHVHGVIDEIAPIDSVERFEGLGVQVIQAAARFKNKSQVEVGDYTVSARRFVVSTGSVPAIPPIPGLQDVPFLTNEVIFDNTDCPEHLLIIGGGPIGMEMAQAHRRLGARVTVVEASKAFSKDDPEMSAIVLDELRKEGIEVLEGLPVTGVEKNGDGVAVMIGEGEAQQRLEGSHLLVAAGRAPTVDGLNLEAAGIKYSKRGIEVDQRLRTSNKRVFAIGDVAGGLQFTHVAGYHSGIVVQNALFRVPAKADHSAVPWVTYTDPELAHVGLSEVQAVEAGHQISVLRWPLAENDRAQAERKTTGMIKVIVAKNGKILGATIVAPNAGDLLQPWILAISQKLKIRAFTSLIAPYPTMGEISKRVASSFYTPTLFSPRTRRLVALLSKFG